MPGLRLELRSLSIPCSTAHGTRVLRPLGYMGRSLFGGHYSRENPVKLMYAAAVALLHSV